MEDELATKSRFSVDLPPFLKLLSLAFLIMALLLFEFGDTLSSYFTSDDFTHINYVYRALDGHPWLIFSTFLSAWTQDTSTEIFYRPVTELSFALDFLLSGVNPFGYHFSNLIYSLIASLSLFFIGKHLCETFEIENGNIVGLASAILFAVNPLHTEAATWIVGRVDGLSTMFYLLSFSLFLEQLDCKHGLTSSKHQAVNLSLAFFMLGMLSKEMVCTLPFVIFLYIICAARQQKLSVKVKQGVRLAAPYFAILGLCVLIRFLVLGTIFGGYVGAADETIDLSFAAFWGKLTNLWKVAFPFNEELMSKGTLVEHLLRLIYLIFGVFLFGRIVLERISSNYLRCMGFLFGWFVLQMMPLYQVFTLSQSLAGNRFLYLGTAVLSIFISVLLVPGNISAPQRMASAFKLFAAILFCSIIGLNTFVGKKNNQCWIAAAAQVIALKKQILIATERLPSDQKVLIAFLPHQINGAHMFYSYYLLKALLTPPLCFPELATKVCVLEPRFYMNDRLVPSGVLRDRLKSSKYRVMYWDEKSASLSSLTPRNENLDSKLMVEFLQGNDEVSLIAEPPIIPMSVQFIEVDIEVLDPNQIGTKNKLELKIDLKHEFPLRLANYVEVSHDLTKNIQTLRFPVDEAACWFFLKNVSRFSIHVGKEPRVRVLAARCNNGATLVPSIHPAPDTLRECNDGVYRSFKFPIQFEYDVGNVTGASDCMIELSGPGKMFQSEGWTFRSTEFSGKAMRRWKLADTKGRINVERNWLPSNGCYQIRVFAVDPDGSICGTSSDVIYLGINDRPKGQEL